MGGTIQDMRVCCKETIYQSSFSQSNTPLAFFLNYFFPISLSLLKKVLKTITSKVATKKKKNLKNTANGGMGHHHVEPKHASTSHI